jgi:N-methylhydantoinase A
VRDQATHDRPSNGAGWKFAVDVGGTFTDVVVISPTGAVGTTKLLSTPGDFGRAVIDGVTSLGATADCSAADVVTIVHATTIATNSILERKGPRAGLVTTRGFRDVLELRRIRFPESYNLRWEKPPALVPRRLRQEVDERIGARGELVGALDLEGARVVLRQLVEEEQIETLAICLINAYVNPEHELRLKELVTQMYPGIQLSISSEVLPEIKEYERTSTTVLNAYLKPVVSDYLRELKERLTSEGYESPLYLMQESGGVTTARSAESFPIHIVESGAAAGVIGGCEVIRAKGLAQAITFDMGGTTAKACLVENGEPARTSEYEIGASISAGSRLLRGGGDLLRAPALDMIEVGAGAGSIVTVDSAGALHVGPESAGARPGPVCYSLGGTEPTVTDANVVLGYLPQAALLGGTFPIDPRAAHESVARVSDLIGSDVLDTAFGIHQIANASMVRAIRSVTTERGRDPREYTLIVFGGSGPTHAMGIAAMLGIPRVVVPRWPGVFSALGLLFAPIERRVVKALVGELGEIGPTRLQQGFDDLEDRVAAELVEEGYDRSSIVLSRSAELHYRGQWYELEVPVPAGQITTSTLGEVERAFERAYEVTYGYKQDRRKVDLVSMRVAGSIPPKQPRLAALSKTEAGASEYRSAYFAGAIHETPVFQGRERLGRAEEGPLIIDEFDTTIVVPPGATVELDAEFNVVVALDAVP